MSSKSATSAAKPSGFCVPVHNSQMPSCTHAVQFMGSIGACDRYGTRYSASMTLVADAIAAAASPRFEIGDLLALGGRRVKGSGELVENIALLECVVVSFPEHDVQPVERFPGLPVTVRNHRYRVAEVDHPANTGQNPARTFHRPIARLRQTPVQP